MKKTILFALACAIAILLPSCDGNQDKVKAIEKDGAVHTEIHISHQDKFDLVTTEHRVWIKNDIVQYFTHTDTLPSLGTTRETGEDSDGNEVSVDVPKNYTLFITVK